MTIILTVGLLMFLSCGESDQKVHQTLSGTVYQSSDGLDDNCKIIPNQTDYFQTLLFLNDSEFVKTVNTCCGEPGEDFASLYCYSGTYKMDEKSLMLTFNSQRVVYYSKESLNETGDSSSVSSTHIETEKSDLTILKFDRLNCKAIIYFKQRDGDFIGEFISPITDTFDNQKNDLVKLGVWKKLFPTNNN